MIEIFHQAAPLLSDREVKNIVLTSWRLLQRRLAERRLSVAWIGSRESLVLNRAYRGNVKPTNVLSFMYGKVRNVYSSEVILCSPLVRREAREAKIPLKDYAARLLVHGLLHTEGFDHQTRRDCKAMERREKELLHKCGYDQSIIS